MRLKILVAIPVILIWGVVLAQELGLGSPYGLLEFPTFQGDLTTDIALQDSSDNVIDIAAGQKIACSAKTVLDPCTTDGQLGVTNNAGDNISGVICSGPANNPNSMCIGAYGTHADSRTGTGNAAEFHAGGFATKGSVATTGFSWRTVNGSHYTTERGFLGWSTATSGNGGADGVRLYSNYLAANEHYLMTNLNATSITDATSTFRMGDMKSGAGDLPTCDTDHSGTLNHAQGGTNENEMTATCIQYYDGSSETYRWANPGYMTSHYYITHGNAVITDIPDNTGWHPICGSTSSACDGTDIWNVGLSSGFSLGTGANDGDIIPAGLWQSIDGTSNYFEVSYSLSFSNSGSAVTYETTIEIDDGEGVPSQSQADCYTIRKLSAGGDVGNVSAQCVIALDVDGTNDDFFYLVIKGDAATDVTVVEGNLTVRAM